MNEGNDDTTGASLTEMVAGWLLFDAGDPAVNGARDAVESLGREVQQRAGRVAAESRQPLTGATAHREDGGDIARTLAALRDELDALDPSELDGERGWFTRAIGKVPGVGTPADRYLQRLASSRSKISAIVHSLEAGRGVLARDNSTLRMDQEQLSELSTSLDTAMAEVQALDDALVFAIDVELPTDDARRELFEDDLLAACRRRMSDLDQARVVNEQATAAIESVISTNREMMRGIDRTRDLTNSALAVAAMVGAAGQSNAAVFDGIDAATAELITATEIRLRTDGRDVARANHDTSIELRALRAAFDEIDAELNDLDGRRTSRFAGQPVTPQETR